MEDLPSLRIAYTPDSDDAFYYDALETGRVRLPGCQLTLCRQPISALNRAALDGLHHVTAISSVTLSSALRITSNATGSMPRRRLRGPGVAGSFIAAPSDRP